MCSEYDTDPAYTSLLKKTSMTETIFGIITAVIIILISRFKPLYLTQKLFAATILVAIAFIYVGFSLKENQVSFIVLECGFALLLYILRKLRRRRLRSPVIRM